MPANTSPDNIVYPTVGDKIAPLAPVFGALATSTQAAFNNVYRAAPVWVGSAEERNARFPNPVTGNRVYRTDRAYTQIYYAANFRGIPFSGWYVEPGVSVGRTQEQHNPVPTAITTIPNTSMTFSLAANEVVAYDIRFGATLQLNIGMGVTLYCILNNNGISNAVTNVSDMSAQRLTTHQTIRVTLTAGNYEMHLAVNGTESNAAVAHSIYFNATTIIPLSTV